MDVDRYRSALAYVWGRMDATEAATGTYDPDTVIPSDFANWFESKEAWYPIGSIKRAWDAFQTPVSLVKR